MLFTTSPITLVRVPEPPFPPLPPFPPSPSTNSSLALSLNCTFIFLSATSLIFPVSGKTNSGLLCSPTSSTGYVPLLVLWNSIVIILSMSTIKF
jgi:hypothetical protein